MLGHLSSHVFNPIRFLFPIRIFGLHRRHMVDWPHYYWTNEALISIGQLSTSVKDHCLVKSNECKNQCKGPSSFASSSSNKVGVDYLRAIIVCFSRLLFVQQTTVCSADRNWGGNTGSTHIHNWRHSAGKPTNTYIYINIAHSQSLATWCEIKKY